MPVCAVLRSKSQAWALYCSGDVHRNVHRDVQSTARCGDANDILIVSFANVRVNSNKDTHLHGCLVICRARQTDHVSRCHLTLGVMSNHLQWP